MNNSQENKDKFDILKNFLNDDEKDPKEEIKVKDGLIERVDKIYVTQNGKQLLKEIYR